MFNHEQGVTQITEFSQGGKEAVVVALVQADGWFVEHVHDAGQAASNLRGQTDSLTFTAREGVCFPVQGEVVQPDAVEEAESPFDFLDDFRADEHASLIKGFEKVLKRFRWAVAFGIPRTNQTQRIVHRALADLGQANTAHRDIPGSLVQFLTSTCRTVQIRHARNQSISRSLAGGFGVGLLKARDDALPRFAVLVLRAVFGGKFVVNDGGARTVQQDILLILIQHLEGKCGGDVVVLTRAFQQLTVPRGGHRLSPRDDAAVGDAQRSVNDEFNVELALNAQPLARSARSQRRVE